MPVTTEVVEEAVGEPVLDDVLDAVADEFPDVDDRPAPSRLEELLLLRLANENPAARPLRDLVDDSPLPAEPRQETITALEAYQADLTPIGPNGETLVELLRAPARAHPTSLAGQLRYVREHWRGLLGADLDVLLDRLLVTLDVDRRGGARPAPAVRRWRRRGLGRRPRRGARPHGPRRRAGAVLERLRLDAAPRPDRQEHARLARPAVAALRARHPHAGRDPGRGARPARALGHHRPVADRPVGAQPGLAHDQDLARQPGRGGVGVLARRLPDRRRPRRRGGLGGPAAAARGPAASGSRPTWSPTTWASTRAGSSSTPTGSSRSPSPPTPATRSAARTWPRTSGSRSASRTTTGTTATRRSCSSGGTGWSGDRRYLYHGNDGTSFPWNDTAQLDFSQAAVREQVIRTIVDVARRFPVIRFDAAMVLARKHVRRLWFPGPGEGGGAIPSRAEFGTMSQAEFDAAMPAEFWREVVDRVAVEAPDTLLLAEAFWLLEGYFVRTLGMHRVYNSAFMHMLRDEDNAGYRRVLKETLEFDPEILKRYVNFMNNPDEKSAAEQFGKGDKYVGVATLLATLPGLPMFGHGQFEGFAEKYGMEFRRASMDEQPDPWLIERHEREIVPLLHRRGRLRRGARLPAVRLRGRRWRGRRARVRLFERLGALAVADRLPQPVRGDDGLDPRLGRVRAQGGRRVEVDGAANARRRARGGRWAGRRPVAGASRAAVGPRVPAFDRRGAGARPPRLAAGVRDARVLGAARAVRRRGRVGPAGRAAGRSGRAVARGGAAGAAAGPGARRAAGGRSTMPSDAAGRAPGRGRRGGDGHGRAIARRSRTRCGRWSTPSRRSRSGSRTRRRPRRSASGRCCGRSGRSPRVRRWGRRAGRGSRSCGSRRRSRMRCDRRASTRPAPGGRPSGCACCWTCRCRRRSGGRGGAATLPLRLVDAWLADPVVRSFLRINRWDDADWFHRESWAELLAWTDRLERATDPGRRPRRAAPSSAPSSAVAWPRQVRRPATRSRRCEPRSPSRRRSRAHRRLRSRASRRPRAFHRAQARTGRPGPARTVRPAGDWWHEDAIGPPVARCVVRRWVRGDGRSASRTVRGAPPPLVRRAAPPAVAAL